ncbi:MAG: DUF4837 family protein [Bacteroidales bacterium]|jgi:hypothetical protein|nr:DUF4837 family protein [Bacteroidales bacterium]
MRKYSFLLIFIALLFNSCDYEKVTALQGSTGVTYELLIVAPTEIWKGEAGETVRSFFNQPDSTMFMTEPLYTTPQITQEQLDNNEMFRRFKSMLIIEIEQGRTPKIETRDTIWATPQRIFKIIAPDIESFNAIFNEYKEYMLEKYTEIERDKLNRYFETALNKPIIKQVGEKFGYTMNITTGFYVAKDLQDFMWLRSETSKTSTNILIYVEDYVSEAQLTESYIKLKRNMITQENIPASLVDSYAKVSDIFPLTTKSVDFNGKYATEVRGAWDAHNDVMGGTFLNYTIVDEVNNKILTLDGFIYAPNKEKRTFMMQLEAIFWSLRYY